MAEFNMKLKGVDKEELLSALLEMKAEAEATEKKIFDSMSEEIKDYMFKVAEMSTENQKKVFDFIDSIVQSN